MAQVDRFRLTRRVKGSVEFPCCSIVDRLISFHLGMVHRTMSNVACQVHALRLYSDLQLNVGIHTAIYHAYVVDVLIVVDV